MKGFVDDINRNNQGFFESCKGYRAWRRAHTILLWLGSSSSSSSSSSVPIQLVYDLMWKSGGACRVNSRNPWRFLLGVQFGTLDCVCKCWWYLLVTGGCFQKYGKTPKSSILIGFSIINHPFWGTSIFGNILVVFGCIFISFAKEELAFLQQQILDRWHSHACGYAPKGALGPVSWPKGWTDEQLLWLDFSKIMVPRKTIGDTPK